MLDIRYIRENQELVQQKANQKGFEVDIPRLIEIDKKRRELFAETEKVRAERNQVATLVTGEQPSQAKIEKGKELKVKLENLERDIKPVDEEFIKLLKAVPNMPADDVAVGSSEKENVVSKEWGEKPNFDFKPKTHWEIAEPRGLIDKERAAKVTGSRFAYIKGDLVLLQFAIIQFVLATLTNEETIKKIVQKFELKNVSSKPFMPILPPAMIRTSVFDDMDRLEPREERYRVGADEDDLWLQGSAEHTIGPMHMDEILPSKDLPCRYLGFLTSFRREAGSYGKDTEGIIRMHQFDKLEMESFTSPEQGMSEHLFFVATQEYLMQQLGIPYRVLNKCTADIGKPNARGVDIDAWLPGQNRYLETHTADFMTDYQARRLKTRTKNEKDEMQFVHTNDATAFALARTMVAIIDNFQKADGSVGIPEVLQPYMGGKKSI